MCPSISHSTSHNETAPGTAEGGFTIGLQHSNSRRGARLWIAVKGGYDASEGRRHAFITPEVARNIARDLLHYAQEADNADEE